MLQEPATRRTFVTGMLCVGAGAVCRIVAGDDVQKDGTGVKLSACRFAIAGRHGTLSDVRRHR